MSRIAYVTSELGLEVDEEVGYVCDGLGWHPVRWDDAAADWSSYGLAICRSPWDYTWRRGEFVDWARRVEQATRLVNPADVLVWNTDKTYLRRLSAAGVPVVPTLWEVPERMPWPDVVVKPAVSAGARDTIRTASLDEARRHAQEIVASGKPVMLQPYLPATEGEGETSIVWIGGAASHAVRKGAMLSADAVSDDPRYDIRARELTDELVRFSDRVLAAVPERADLLYARVDVIRATDGELMLMELELTEPYLFLREGGDDAALDRLERAAAALLR